MSIENQKSFRIEPAEGLQEPADVLALRVLKIKKEAMGHVDELIGETYYESAAFLADTLRTKATEEELAQVASYHALTGSGIATGTEFDQPISATKRDEIEATIQAFLEEQQRVLDAATAVH